MSDFDPNYYADIINGNGESGVVYANESLRESDVENAIHELEINDYALDVWGNPYHK
ncbi:MAG: hypothetical protein J6W43_00210 [Prevotella sp.]|nr:hypothetical protein [Prevotella sp.]